MNKKIDTKKNQMESYLICTEKCRDVFVNTTCQQERHCFAAGGKIKLQKGFGAEPAVKVCTPTDAREARASLNTPINTRSALDVCARRPCVYAATALYL